MVLLCGIPTDSPFEMIGDALEEKNIPFLTLSQLDYEPLYISYQVAAGKITGELGIRNRSYALDEITGVYNRMTDVQLLQDYKKMPADRTQQTQVLQAHQTLSNWISISTARVLNPNRAMASNSSKPYQMMLIEQYGFKTPRSIITNRPEVVLAFRRQWGQLIYKSASGVRSIVQEFGEKAEKQLKAIIACPTLFQQLVAGTNIRVHVVGNQLFATKITTDTIDYRYAHKYGGQTRLETYELPETIQQQCFALSRGLQLALVGIDLLLTPDNEYYCFEANPSPGFSYFEHHTGQPIAAAIAGYLAGE